MAEEEYGSSSSSGSRLVAGLSFFFVFVTMWQAVNSEQWSDCSVLLLRVFSFDVCKRTFCKDIVRCLCDS